ncbi:hypothetical protein AB0D59_44620 [Streptomyces sp. NPDC048417]|uniref:hypothetical protein n=1 Tax=Streptomyces sp. NPDC048417 TaxID=3155387 RepID=UPI00343CE20C
MQRRRGEREGVRQDGRRTRIAARHLVLAADPDEAVLADRVDHRDGGGQRQPLPRRGEVDGQSAQRHQAQQRGRLLDEIHPADRRPRPAHHAGQRPAQGSVDREVAPGPGTVPHDVVLRSCAAGGTRRTVPRGG